MRVIIIEAQQKITFKIILYTQISFQTP